MKRWLLVGLLLAGLPLEAEQEKLGYVYSDRILSNYQGMADPTTALNRAKTEFKQTADSLYRLLTQARNDFEAEKLLLSEEGKAAKQAGIDEQQRRYDGYIADVYGPGGKLEQKNQELMEPVIQKIKDAVEKIALNEGYSIVFDASESKLAILYATAAANLTSDVLDELGREFKPVTPGVPTEKRYAVCPLYEANDEAQQAGMGEQCRALIYEVVRAQPRTQMVNTAELNSGLQNQGVSGRAKIDEPLALRVGKDLQADYIFFGSVTQTGKKTTVTLSIAEPSLSKTYPPETATANRPEELKPVVGNITGKLLRKLTQQ